MFRISQFLLGIFRLSQTVLILQAAFFIFGIARLVVCKAFFVVRPPLFQLSAQAVQVLLGQRLPNGLLRLGPASQKFLQAAALGLQGLVNRGVQL